VNSTATLRDVTMRFREQTALDGVSLSIEQDSITGLLGRNGAGKTTLLQLLTGHRLPTRGSVEVFGAAPYENDAVLADIAFIKEGQRYPDAFRVRDAWPPRPWSSRTGTTTWPASSCGSSTCPRSGR
jgi:ABC-2 type transport system ATP-binding protein